MVRLFNSILSFSAHTRIAAEARGLALVPLRLEDTSSLLQGGLWHARVSRGAGVEAAWEALADDERTKAPPSHLSDWPQLGDVWDNVKDGASNLTDALGDLSADVEQKVPNTAKSIGPAVRAVAAGLSIGLQTICKEMDSLLNETIQDKAKLVTKLCGTAPPLQQLLPQFEDAMDEVLGGAGSRWGSIQDAVDRAVASLASGLQAGGQRPLARSLRLNMRIAQAQADHWLRSLSKAKQEVHGSQEIAVSELKEHLILIQDELHEAMQHLSHFTTLFQQAFIDLIDTISNRLLWATPEDDEDNVNLIFSLVQHEVTRVAWRTRAAARELVSGARMGLVSVAKAANETLPPWRTVSIPLLMGSARTGAVPQGLFLLVAVVLAIVHH